MKAKDVVKTIGLIGAGFVIGNVKGIVDCGNAINEKLTDHKIEASEVWWKPIGCKIDKVVVKEIEKTEGSAE